jgi:hypothetical protein
MARHLRSIDQLKWGFTVDPEKQTIELFEIRPYFMDESKIINHPFARRHTSKKTISGKFIGCGEIKMA